MSKREHLLLRYTIAFLGFLVIALLMSAWFYLWKKKENIIIMHNCAFCIFIVSYYS